MDAHHAATLRLALRDYGGEDASLCGESSPEPGRPVQSNLANDRGTLHQGNQLVDLAYLGSSDFRMQPQSDVNPRVAGEHT